VSEILNGILFLASDDLHGITDRMAGCKFSQKQRYRPRWRLQLPMEAITPF